MEGKSKEKEVKSKKKEVKSEEKDLKVKKIERNADYTDFPSLEDRVLEYDEYAGIDKIIDDYHQICSLVDNYYISNSDRIFYWARKIYFTTDPYEQKELLDAFISAGYMFPREYIENGSFDRRLDYLLHHASADTEGADEIRVMRICQHLTAPRGLSSYGPYPSFLRPPPFVDQMLGEKLKRRIELLLKTRSENFGREVKNLAVLVKTGAKAR